MRLSVTLSFPAPPSRVGRMLLDPDFLHRVCEATGDAQARIDIDAAGDPARVETLRRLPTDRLPEAIRAIVGAHVDVLQSSRWAADRGDTGWTGRTVVSVKGKPVHLDATASVTPQGSGTAVVYEGDLVARLPFVGGKVERGIEPLVRSAIEAEQRIGVEWLADHPA